MGSYSLSDWIGSLRERTGLGTGFGCQDDFYEESLVEPWLDVVVGVMI